MVYVHGRANPDTHSMISWRIRRGVSSIWKDCERPNLGGLVLVVVVHIGVPAVDELVLGFQGVMWNVMRSG